MGKPQNLGHLAHIVAYNAENHITVPAGITMHTNQLVASQSWVTTALGSYALSSSLSSYVPTSRTITINGTTFDLSANRNWDITSMIYPAAGIALSTGSAWGTSITNNSANWNTAFGWGNHASAGYLTGITSAQVTTALGFTPYNATNPAGYITGISFANVSSKPTTLSGYGITDAVPSSRTITINGTTWDLSANRSFTVTATETDTLATVTARGATTSDIVTFTSTTSAASVIARNDGSGTSWRGRIGHFNATADKSVWLATYNGFAVVGAHNNALTAWADLLVNCVNNNGDGGTTRLSTSSFVGTNAIIHAGNIGSQSVSNATTAGGLSVHAGRNNEANKIVRTDGNGYIQAGYINSTSGNENNNSNADRVWGTNGSDDYLRTYRTSALSVGYAASSGNSSTTSQRDFNYLRINSNNHLYLDYNHGQSIIGVYSSYRYQGVFSMGAAYVLPLDGTTPGNLYGMAWSHPNAGGQAGYLNDHGLLVMVNGVTYAAISSNIWARGNITANGQFNGSGAGLSGTASSLTAGNANTVGGISESRIVYGDGPRASTSSSNMNDPNQKSGFHFYYDPSGRPYAEWWNWMTVAGNSWQSSNNYSFQFAHAFHNDDLYVRRMTNGSAAGWRYILTDANYNSYAPTKTGGGASGSWNIGITGAAGSLAYNATADNIYNYGWFRNYGDSGLYNQDYGCHLRRNASSSYGSWEIFGYTKGGYVGLNLVDPSGYWSNLMFENGSGGIYQQNGQSWLLYFYYGNDCLGLSGSETYDWVRACTNGKHRITNDSWCDATSWAYTFSNISDGRLKENIITVDSALEKVLQLRGVYYNWIIDTENKKHIGLIAQETAAVCPEVVNYHEETDTYSVNYSELSGLFVESTKELNQKLMDANARIELLESKLNQLLNA